MKTLRPWLKRKRKAPVTIIIAIKSQDGIVLACDSRSTDISGLVRDDAVKLSVVTFRDGSKSILAQAGAVDTASIAVEKIANKAKARELKDYRSGADIVQEVMEEMKQDIRKQFVGTGEELQQHFDQYAFELMLAHYFEGKPYIFTADFLLGLPVKRDNDCVSMGCGWVLADFLLNSMDFKQFNVGHAIWTAIYAVEQIKLFDGRCGGPTRTAVANIHPRTNKNNGFLGTPEWMQENVPFIVDFANVQRAEWVKSVESKIAEIMKKRSQPPPTE